MWRPRAGNTSIYKSPSGDWQSECQQVGQRNLFSRRLLLISSDSKKTFLSKNSPFPLTIFTRISDSLFLLHTGIHPGPSLRGSIDGQAVCERLQVSIPSKRGFACGTAPGSHVCTKGNISAGLICHNRGSISLFLRFISCAHQSTPLGPEKRAETNGFSDEMAFYLRLLKIFIPGIPSRALYTFVPTHMLVTCF